MKRRDLLRIAPLAALAAVPIKVGASEGQGYELRSDKKYLIAIKSDVSQLDIEHLSESMKGRGIDGFVVAGPDLDLSIYEIQ